MARCEDCIHKKVCAEVESLQCRRLFAWYNAEWGCPYFNAADVAPKSEVEELSDKYEDLKLKYADLQKDHDELLAWGGHIKSAERAEIGKAVAREIFEEIEVSIAVHAYTSKSEDYDDGMFDAIEWVDSKIAELKKKRTEEKG